MFTEEERTLGTGNWMCDLCNYFIKTFHCSNVLETFGIAEGKGVFANDKCLKVFCMPHSVSPGCAHITPLL